MGVVTEKRGPVFYSAFNPLCTVMVAILGSIILAEEMYLGRLASNTNINKFSIMVHYHLFT
jgi:hypothetical protein